MKKPENRACNHSRGSVERIHGLDLLRGSCAIGVACYHVLYWQNVVHVPVLGTYGVYIFFVLSGVSLFVNYSRSVFSPLGMVEFVRNRFFRLVPLYSLVVLGGAFAGVFLRLVRGRSAFEAWTWEIVATQFLNISMLFGFANPGETSAATGGWSIGIEFAFYTIFPVCVALVVTNLSVPALFATFVGQRVFIALTLGQGSGFEQSWIRYTQIIAFLFYFLAGCYIGQLVSLKKPAKQVVGIVFVFSLATLAAASALIRSNEDSLGGVIGMILAISVCLLTWAAAHLQVWSSLRSLADVFGSFSYGLYLLHPLVFAALNNKAIDSVWEILPNRSVWLVKLIITIGVSCVAALVLERYFEAPIRRYGRKLALRGS